MAAAGAAFVCTFSLPWLVAGMLGLLKGEGPFRAFSNDTVGLDLVLQQSRIGHHGVRRLCPLPWA